jgi:hypothetical protein
MVPGEGLCRLDLVKRRAWETPKPGLDSDRRSSARFLGTGYYNSGRAFAAADRLRLVPAFHPVIVGGRSLHLVWSANCSQRNTGRYSFIVGRLRWHCCIRRRLPELELHDGGNGQHQPSALHLVNFADPGLEDSRLVGLGPLALAFTRYSLETW